MTRATIMIPTEQHGPIEVTGEVMRLDVAGKEIRFLCHKSPRASDGMVLTHYASGMRFGPLGSIKLLRFVGRGREISDREAAKELIAKAIAINGAPAVLAKLAAAKTINT